MLLFCIFFFLIPSRSNNAFDHLRLACEKRTPRAENLFLTLLQLPKELGELAISHVSLVQEIITCKVPFHTKLFNLRLYGMLVCTAIDIFCPSTSGTAFCPVIGDRAPHHWQQCHPLQRAKVGDWSIKIQKWLILWEDSKSYPFKSSHRSDTEPPKNARLVTSLLRKLTSNTARKCRQKLTELA
jgi:hypothetical protein